MLGASFSELCPPASESHAAKDPPANIEYVFLDRRETQNSSRAHRHTCISRMRGLLQLGAAVDVHLKAQANGKHHDSKGPDEHQDANVGKHAARLGTQTSAPIVIPVTKR